MESTSLFLTQNNYDTESGDFILKFNSPQMLNGYEISLIQSNVYKQWFNVSDALNNNKIKIVVATSATWSGGTPTYTLNTETCKFPDGYYSIKELESYFKKWCDEYFYLKQRAETRGIGGIFYDYQEPGAALYRGQNPDGAAAQLGAGLVPERSWEDLFELASACGNAFLNSYCPIVERRNGLDYGERERQFQLYRRGRYVEFNLVYDRGTKFGLETKGRIESILMSLPEHASWVYNHEPLVGSKEAESLNYFRTKTNWL
jgi:coproporphyrinogen III oxidase